MSTLALITDLRNKTGVSLQACKNALSEANGDVEKAMELLRKRGELKSALRGERETGQGVVSSYVHTNKQVGAMVQLSCETDFVARNEEFRQFAYDLAMHIAASNPLYVSPEEVPHDLIEKEREFWKEDLQKSGKPENMWEKILDGKEKKFREEVALTSQPFVKDPGKKIADLLTEMGSKMGENVKVAKFERMSF